VFGLVGLEGLVVEASGRESSFFAESTTNCNAILWHWLSSMRSSKVSIRFTRNVRHSRIWEYVSQVSRMAREAYIFHCFHRPLLSLSISSSNSS
jgi:hypothetical protein